jgi:hypothetical protein
MRNPALPPHSGATLWLRRALLLARRDHASQPLPSPPIGRTGRSGRGRQVRWLALRPPACMSSMMASQARCADAICSATCSMTTDELHEPISRTPRAAYRLVLDGMSQVPPTV